MTEKLEDIKLRFEEVGQLLAQPETVRDMKKFSQLSKEYRDLEKIVIKFNIRSKKLRNLISYCLRACPSEVSHAGGSLWLPNALQPCE